MLYIYFKVIHLLNLAAHVFNWKISTKLDSFDSAVIQNFKLFAFFGIALYVVCVKYSFELLTLFKLCMFYFLIDLSLHYSMST